MLSILSTDFNQSSACSGSKELENIGGLWLINSVVLIPGGAGGGGGGSCCRSYRSWHIFGVLASFPVVLDESVHAFLSSCWPFVIIIAFEQQSRHQHAGDSEEDSLLVPD